MRPASLPSATYRLQFNASFTFADATAIVDYLDALGVTHAYASSYFKAVPGSAHGYDVADPTQLNPEIGDEHTYATWVARLRAHGMGHIIDLVPNHMGIAQSANAWWQDVLENGPGSRYASVFDIDWHPLKPELEQKVLLPVLGDVYGAVLERQQITLVYERGAFSARYFEHVFPIAPPTYERILEHELDALLAEIGEESAAGIELLSVLTALRHLPRADADDPQLRAERDREKEVIKRRLAALTTSSPRVLAHVERAVCAFNGRAGDPASFDRLDDLLSAQRYRLSYWRVAAEEINYRRFFDINELAAIHVEDPAVFDRTHGFAFELLARGAVDGFRIDHVDGLYDPAVYLQRLQARARELRPDLYTDRPLYLVVEKILGRDEVLPDWPVEGTTGYDFLAAVNGVFIDRRNLRAVNEAYERFTRLRLPFREICYRGKQLILRVSMPSELNVLAHRLNRFSERNRHYRDFTLNSLNQAMREIIACFPVYRSYVDERADGVSDRDRAYIEEAVSEAKTRNPNRPAAVYDFVRDLLLKRASSLGAHERDDHMRFVAMFQQVTSPVTAKGIEDTALYIYNRLVSLNEVGDDPDRFGVAPEALHHWLKTRASRWPHGLSTTSTHDTKRSEDVRARINVLSEMPEAWKTAASRWARINRRGRTTIDGQSYPSRNEEYLLYQTLVGTWPLEPLTPESSAAYHDRIVAYMHKAMREAKIYTSWINRSERHEDAMARFVAFVLDPAHHAFRNDFLAFQRRVATCGIYNSLAQLTIKVCAPGVPDFYQGCELWDLTLVDPDNRRPVDYERRRALLASLDEEAARDGHATLAARLLDNSGDGRLKLYATAMMTRFRRDNRALFEEGDYQALAPRGRHRDHLFAFSRTAGTRQVIVAVPRLAATLLPDAESRPLGEAVWGDTHLPMPCAGRQYVNILTGEPVSTLPSKAAGAESEARLDASSLFLRFPIALLDAR